MSEDNKRGDRIPHLNKIIILISAAWLVTAATSRYVMDTLISLLEAYTNTASPVGWYTFTAAVVVTTVTLVGILVREVRK